MKEKEQGLGKIIGIAMGVLIFMNTIFMGIPIEFAVITAIISTGVILMTTMPIGERGGFAKAMKCLNPEIDIKIIGQMSYRQSDVISNIVFWFIGFIVPIVLTFVID